MSVATAALDSTASMASETFLLPIYRCLDIPLGLSYRTGRAAVQVIFAVILHRNKYVSYTNGVGDHLIYSQGSFATRTHPVVVHRTTTFGC